MHLLHWVANLFLHSLPEMPCIVCEGQRARHRSRADHGLKEEVGSHHGCHLHLGGVRGGHAEDSSAEEAARQGQPFDFELEEDRTMAPLPINPFWPFWEWSKGVEKCLEDLQRVAKAWRDEAREQRERVKKVEKEVKRLRERVTELEMKGKGKGKEKEDM